MTGDSFASSLYLVFALVLVCSGFAVRRLPIRRTLAMLFGWVAIFGIGYVVVSFRHDIGDLFASRVAGRAIVEGDIVQIPMAEDGHFWLDAKINGESVRLMVDSGATITTLSPATARAAEIAASGLSTRVETANGPISMRRGRAETFEVGNIAVADMEVHLAANDFDVVGMNFLSKLSRWSVEGRWLVMQK